MQNRFELTEKQAEYIRNCNHRWNVSCGAVRSGKSYLQISYLIPSRILERKDKRGLIVFLGATRANIERNILQPIRDLYGDSAATEINSRNYAKVFGVRVYCVGADKVSQVAKIRGSEISYCAIDEALDVHEEVFEMLKSRLSLPWSCCDITTSPGRPTHYFKEFLDSAGDVDIYCQNYTIYDNPFLPPDYVRNLEAEYKGTVWFDRLILGEWTLAEGLVFPNFSLALEGPQKEPVEEYGLSLDYGTSNPFACLLWAKRGHVWHVEKELYYSGRDTGKQKTDEEYLQMLIDFARPAINRMKETPVSTGLFDFGPDRIEVVIDPSAASFIALLRQSEYFKPRSANNDVVNGLRETYSAINSGLIKVNRACANWKVEAQSYVWDPDSEEDKPVKENDHLMDAMRYWVKTKRLVKKADPWESPLERR